MKKAIVNIQNNQIVYVYDTDKFQMSDFGGSWSWPEEHIHLEIPNTVILIEERSVVFFDNLEVIDGVVVNKN